VGNGDLRIAFAIASVYQTLGLLLTLLDAPFSAEARSDLFKALRHILRPPGQDAYVQAEALNTLLARSLEQSRLQDMQKFMAPGSGLMGWLDRYTRVSLGIRVAFFMPLLFANLIGKFILLIIPPLLIGPLIALVWRSRRYLADATSVQLMRNPQGMADALIELIDKGGIPPGGKWAAHLFVVGTEGAQLRAKGTYRDAIRRLDMDGAVRRGWLRTGDGVSASPPTVNDPNAPGGMTEDYAILVNFHPSLKKRLQRLRAQGAMIS
jgi:hypothetical protein